MKPAVDLRSVMESPLLQREYPEADHLPAPSALPDVALNFLVELAREIKAVSIFEFGSGRSTQAFLQNGFQVTSLEDDAYWMEQTLSHLSSDEKSRLTPLVHPLKSRFHGILPMRDWVIDSDLDARLKNADMILVDSPNYVPFRESTLWSALNHSPDCVVVLDDVRIPTVRRFCDNLVKANPGMLHRRVRVGHTFDLFVRPKAVSLRFHHSPLEIAKGYRRYFLQSGLQ